MCANSRRGNDVSRACRPPTILRRDAATASSDTRGMPKRSPCYMHQTCVELRRNSWDHCVSISHFRFAWTFLAGLRYFGHRRFGEQQHARDGYCIFERDADDLGRIDDARLDQIDILLRLASNP